jgi:hypothetical protein
MSNHRLILLLLCSVSFGSLFPKTIFGPDRPTGEPLGTWGRSEAARPSHGPIETHPGNVVVAA